MSSKKCVGRGGVERGTYLPEEGEVRVRANRASCNPSRLGFGWVYICGGGLGFGLVVRLIDEGACACGFPVPRNGLLGPLRIIRSRAGVS